MATTSSASGSSGAKATTTTKPTPDVAPVVSSDVEPEIAAGQSVEETKIPAGYAGTLGFDELHGEPVAEKRADIMARVSALAPHVTPEFVKAYGISDETLKDIADGFAPPPPAIGPNHTSDLYLTPGGWIQEKPGRTPGETTAISR